MTKDEIKKMAQETPKFVIDAFAKVLGKYPLDLMKHMAMNDDAVTFGEFVYDLYKVDNGSDVINYLSTEDGGLIDGGRLQLAIIALDLLITENKICNHCGEAMKYDGMSEDEPLEVYRCTKCSNVNFKAINGYEG